jgi:hypothetical protein
MADEKKPLEGEVVKTDQVPPDLAAEAERLAAIGAHQDNKKDPAMEAQQQQAMTEAEKIRAKTIGGINMGLGPVFQFMTPNWGVSKDEVEMLSTAYADLLLLYYPQGLTALGPWIGAVMVTGMVFGPRMDTPRKAPEVPENKPETTASA